MVVVIVFGLTFADAILIFMTARNERRSHCFDVDLKSVDGKDLGCQ
jgi:hypothetical protein